MSATIVLLLQSLLISLQIVNASNELDLSVLWRVALASFIGGFQYFVNHLGNQIDPRKGKKNVDIQ